jgi:hypothetical protein
MSIAQNVPGIVEPAAAALVAELGLQSELDKMLEHARQTITGLQRLQVKFAPAYDTGEEGIIIEAIREPSSRHSGTWTWDELSRWKIALSRPRCAATVLDN